MQLYGKVTDLLSRLGETPESFTGIIPFMSMFNDISCDKKDNERECLANAKVVSIFAKKFGKGQWSFIGPISEKKRVDGQGDGVPKACPQQAADSQGSRTCVCAITFSQQGGTCRGGRMN